MKTNRLLILVTLIAAIGMLMPATASAYGYVGGGYHGGYHGYYGHGYWGRGYWGPGYYPFYGGVVFAWPYYYPPYVDAYYPPVIVPQPVIVDRPVVVRPDVAVVPPYNYQTPVNYNGTEQVRQRRVELLSQLQSPDKAAKLQAISELAGYSFDDQVKAALEHILLSDPDAAMRKEAALSFGKVKNQGALGILEKVRVQDSDREVREAADWAINQIKS